MMKWGNKCHKRREFREKLKKEEINKKSYIEVSFFYFINGQEFSGKEKIMT